MFKSGSHLLFWFLCEAVLQLLSNARCCVVLPDIKHYLKQSGSFSSGMLQTRALNASNRLALLMHTLMKTIFYRRVSHCCMQSEVLDWKCTQFFVSSVLGGLHANCQLLTHFPFIILTQPFYVPSWGLSIWPINFTLFPCWYLECNNGWFSLQEQTPFSALVSHGEESSCRLQLAMIISKRLSAFIIT